jgi:hypothetical protein
MSTPQGRDPVRSQRLGARGSFQWCCLESDEARDVCDRPGGVVSRYFDDLDAVLESDSLDEWSACVRHIDDESSARGITFRRLIGTKRN